MVEFSKLIRKINREGEGASSPGAVEKKNAPQAAPSGKPGVSPSNPSGPPFDEESQALRAIKPLFTNRRPTAPGAPRPTEEPRQTQPAETPSPAASFQGEYMSAHSSVFRDEDALALYDKLIGLAHTIYVKDVDFEAIDTRNITMSIADTAGAIMNGDEKLIELSIARILKDEHSYLLQHAVNTCIISVVIGAGHNYEVGKLIELGMASFLHDIGMVAYEDIFNTPRQLTEKEFSKIKNHVALGEKMLKKMNPALSETILNAQYEIHERMDGSGYPTGRRVIHDYAKIVSLADAFESMIHPRPFRERYSIMEVYKRIFEAKDKYDQPAIKVLVDRIGFFPNGSFVQLNTKETGRVITQNHKSPLRPVIRILSDDKGDKLYEEEVKDISLVKYPTLHIVKCYLQESKG